jgi:hypothetical protein
LRTLDSFTKIVIGFSGLEHLRSEVAKNKAMNDLNTQLVNKSYRAVEESLNASRARSLHLKQKSMGLG